MININKISVLWNFYCSLINFDSLIMYFQIRCRTSRCRLRLTRTYYPNQLSLVHKHDFRCGRRPTAWLCKLCQEALILCKRKGRLHFLDKTPTQMNKSQLQRFWRVPFISIQSPKPYSAPDYRAVSGGYLTHPFVCLHICKCWLRINKAHLYTTNPPPSLS